jgi:hypothetical protein
LVLLCSQQQLEEAVKALNDVFEFDLPTMKHNNEGSTTRETPQACDRCGRYKYKMPETDL